MVAWDVYPPLHTLRNGCVVGSLVKMKKQEGCVLRQMMWMLLFSPWMIQPGDSQAGTCPCDRLMMAKTQVPLPDDTIGASRSGNINCCVAHFLGYPDRSASVLWSFKGENFPWSQEISTFRKHPCYPETLETNGALPTDMGNYTCTVTSSNGTIVTKTMQLDIEDNTDYREAPMGSLMSSDTLATLGANVSFTCEAFVGSSPGAFNPSVVWTKFFPNGSVHTWAKVLPNVKLRTFSDKKGMLTSQLTIRGVKAVHFGSYNCSITNSYGALKRNVKLTEGVPPTHVIMEQYKAAVVATVAVVAVMVVALCVWCRCRLQMALYWRHRTSRVKDGYQYDVFVVHGESASCWVWSVLLPALEDTCGYTCFLPQRDMCGGDQVAESMLGAISRCRRVVVVVSPCLLASPWAVWATYSGIHAALTSPVRILALLLQEVTIQANSPEKNTLIGILKVVRKVRVPVVCGWQPADGEESRLDDAVAIRLEGKDPHRELKLDIPENKVEVTWSNSPKSQRLSNMITGSNAASREDLEADKDKKTEVGGTVIYTEGDFGLQDPGSPCSVTPFILAPCRRTRAASFTVCQSLCRCMQVVCVGDREQQFWQTVRLRLGPPSLRNLDTTASYRA
nr:single Ig IL-1-related receptor-like isoform X3 [Procambarus clarkii]